MKRWQDPSWVEEMKLELDANLMMAPPLSPEAGIEAEAPDRLAPRLVEILRELEVERKEARFPLAHPTLIQGIKKYVRGVKGWVENFVLLGIGGSALGPRALQAALNHPSHNLLSRTMRKGFPRFFVADNVDPDGFSALLNMLDLRKTLFNVVSKSGGTAETMSQYLIVRDLLKRRGGNLNEAEHLVITTDPRDGNLNRIIREERIASFEIPPFEGGRVSVLSAAGLLPAAMVGIDIEELLAGARDMDRRCRGRDLWKNPAALSAALAFTAYREKKKTVRVILPYVDALKGVGDWFAQVWTESLGNRLNRQGQEIRLGQAPLVAQSATDQSGQLPLYAEGPTDKLFTLVGVKSYAASLPIPGNLPHGEGLSYLGGHTLNALIQAEMQATRVTLAKNGRPSLTITLPRVNPFTVGQLLFLLELETYLCGRLLDIDPLGPPGAEEGRALAYALLGREGYADRIGEWAPFIKKESRYVL